MNEVLIEAFRQKDWATKALIAACEDRSVDELTRLAPGFGSILATLNHLVMADAGYVASLGGGRAVWATADNETNDLRELAARAEESGARWERFLREPIDGESNDPRKLLQIVGIEPGRPVVALRVVKVLLDGVS